MHPVFHASLLKKTVSPTVSFQPLPACLNEEWMLEVSPEAVRDRKQNMQGDWEALIKWNGLPEFENSWESVQQLKQEFPDFILEDKDSSEGGGNDSIKSLWGRVYVRKGKNKVSGDTSVAH